MSSLLMKIIMCPLVVIIADFLFPNVDYANIWQPIIVGLVLAAAGVIMEYMILQRGTLWISTFADAVVSLIIVYFVSNSFPDVEVTFFGALLTAVLLGVVEYFTHLWLIQSGRAKKTPA